MKCGNGRPQILTIFFAKIISLSTFAQTPVKIVSRYPKGQLANQLTVSFLIIFLLIKVSPYYYTCQSCPRADISRPSAVRPVTKHHNVVALVYKSFAEKTNQKILPAIKFTGIPFEFFLSGLFVLSLAFCGIRSIRPLCASSAHQLAFASPILRL